MSDDITRETRDDGRVYHVGANTYPSVTTILETYEPKRSALAAWKERVTNWRDVRDRAAIRGTLIHHRVLNTHAIRGLEPPDVDPAAIDEAMIDDVIAACDMWDACEITTMLRIDHAAAENGAPYVEEPVYSHEHRYAGTADMIVGASDGFVVDLKTSSKVRDSHRLQAAAYADAITEMDHLPDVSTAAIVLLDPDTDTNPTLEPHVEWIDQEQLTTLLRTFLDLRSEFEDHDNR